MDPERQKEPSWQIVLKLAANPIGLSFIYNVSQRVGFKQPNLPDDVQLVQFLLREEMKMRPDLVALGLPTLSGKFDAVTGFYLFSGNRRRSAVSSTAS